MSREGRVLRWLDKNQQVVGRIVIKNCKHEFETLKVEHTYKEPYAMWAMCSPVTETVKFCNKCGKRIGL